MGVKDIVSTSLLMKDFTILYTCFFQREMDKQSINI